MKSRQTGSCLVCGGAAVGMNFGVLTCMPCKAFFRRNAVKLGKVDFVCEGNGDCPVTFRFRRMCNCCRLAKCFHVGMQKSLILSDTQKLARKQLVHQNRQKREQLSRIQSLIRPSSLGCSNLETTKALSPLNTTYVTNIIGLYEKYFGGMQQNYNRSFHAIEHTSAHSFFNEHEERHKVLIEYFKHIPEFNSLLLNDKIRLMKNHFGLMVTVNEFMLARCIPQKLIASLNNIFGSSLSSDVIRFWERMLVYIYDPIFLKLVLIVRSLSSGIDRYFEDIDMESIFDDTLSIFYSQNVYVELLWRYIQSKLPSDQEAVKFFSKLITDLLFLQRSSFALERQMCRFNDEVRKMKPLMQTMWSRAEEATVTE